MKKELEPFQREAVDKIRDGVMDGYHYEYETKNMYTNETHYHDVRVEDGVIKDVISTSGKFFNGKENERYVTEPQEKVYKTDNAMSKFMEKAPYRFKEVLDSSKLDDYKQRIKLQQAEEVAERSKLVNTQPEEIESHKSLALDVPDSTKEIKLLKSLALIGFALGVLYFVVKLIKKSINYFKKRKELKSKKNK